MRDLMRQVVDRLYTLSGAHRGPEDAPADGTLVDGHAALGRTEDGPGACGPGRGSPVGAGRRECQGEVPCDPCLGFRRGDAGTSRG